MRGNPSKVFGCRELAKALVSVGKIASSNHQACLVAKLLYGKLDAIVDVILTDVSKALHSKTPGAGGSGELTRLFSLTRNLH
jgi:hypothetical protein